MKINIFVFVILPTLMFACTQTKSSKIQEVEIKQILEKKTLGNLRYWEPPYYEKEFLECFSQKEDFLFTIDGYCIEKFEDWKNIVYESMNHDRRNFKNYHHKINQVNTIILSDSSGVVTVDYVWEYTTNENVEFQVPAVTMSVYRIEDNDWKAYSSHCYHGKAKMIR